VRFEVLVVLTVKNTIFSLAEIYQCFSTTYSVHIHRNSLMISMIPIQTHSIPKHAYLFVKG